MIGPTPKTLRRRQRPPSPNADLAAELGQMSYPATGMVDRESALPFDPTTRRANVPAMQPGLVS